MIINIKGLWNTPTHKQAYLFALCALSTLMMDKLVWQKASKQRHAVKSNYHQQRWAFIIYLRLSCRSETKSSLGECNRSEICVPPAIILICAGLIAFISVGARKYGIVTHRETRPSVPRGKSHSNPHLFVSVPRREALKNNNTLSVCCSSEWFESLLHWRRGIWITRRQIKLRPKHASASSRLFLLLRPQPHW